MNKRVFIIAAIVLITLLFLVKCAMNDISHEAKPVAQEAPVLAPEQPSDEELLPGITQDATDEQKAEEVRRQIAEAQLVIEREGVILPLSGPIDERPEFVSVFEWQLLQFAANNSSASSAKLTELVNLLRFNKLLEYWESLNTQANPATQATQQALAAQLLNEFPERVEAGQVSQAEYEFFWGLAINSDYESFSRNF